MDSIVPSIIGLLPRVWKREARPQKMAVSKLQSLKAKKAQEFLHQSLTAQSVGALQSKHRTQRPTLQEIPQKGEKGQRSLRTTPTPSRTARLWLTCHPHGQVMLIREIQLQLRTTGIILTITILDLPYHALHHFGKHLALGHRRPNPCVR